MWGDMGYIEDDRKRSMDFRLLLRFFRYGRPYAPLFILTCVLTLAATGADLFLPYLTKMAVDRHIVVSAQEVAIAKGPADEARRLLRPYHALLVPTGEPDVFFIDNEKIRRIDRLDLSRWKQAGLISEERYYLVMNRPGPAMDVVRERPDLFRVFPKLAAARTGDLARLDRQDVLRLRADDIRGLAYIALFCCAVLLIGYVFDFTQVILLEYIGQRLTHDLRQSMLAHVLRQSMSFHDRSETGKLTARLTNDIQNLSEMIKSVAVTFFKDAVILIGIVAVLLALDWRLALVTFSLIPPIILITAVFRGKAREVFREQRAKVAEINSFFSETISGIRIVQAFRREAHNRKSFGALNHENYRVGMRQIRVFGIFMPLIDLMASAALALIIWYGGVGVLRETITLGVVVAFIGYVRKFFQPIRDLAEKFNILQSAMASLERVFHLMDSEAALPEKPAPAALPAGSGVIRFEGVNFEYNPGEPVLRNLSIDIRAGETAAIVGATGAGKTSIINLLLRFYDVTSGRILMDGADIRDIGLKAHRSRIGLVMQDVFLFAGSVHDNLALSRPDITRDRVMEAARAVGAHDFISNLPQGYDQLLGEGGRSLSQGERQLLSFARVLLQDPQVLVLDEATAFIDSESEQVIERALLRLVAGRTSIIIAHRLSTIQRADRIVVLHQGRVMEMGSHEELTARQGYYYRLHRIQFMGGEREQ